jgi:hypothetical protein
MEYRVYLTDDPSDNGEFQRLLTLYLEDATGDEDNALLVNTLARSEHRQREFVDMCILRCELQTVLRRTSAPGSHVRSARRLVRLPNLTPHRRWIGRASAIAALLIVVILATISLRPTQQSIHKPSPVARVLEEVGAIGNLPARVNAGLAVGREYVLQRGLCQIRFASGAKVLIQAPARIVIRSGRSVQLSQGRLVAKAVGGGFFVHTPSALIHDLGTWFAVRAQHGGRTFVGVYEGRVTVRPTVGSRRAEPLLLEAGRALRVAVGRMHKVKLTDWRQAFVQSLTVPRNLSLVDLLCGGNGTTGLSGCGINIATGLSGSLRQIGEYSGSPQFIPVPGLPVVDGCFVPCGRYQPIDSAGDRFHFPKTVNMGYYLLWAGGTFVPYQGAAKNRIRPMSSVLAGVNYATAGHHIIYFHPNKGITFNLQAIRRLHPMARIREFHAVFGNTFIRVPPGSGPPLSAYRADFWVMVDGKVRYKKLNFTPANGAITVNVRLHAQDRYLTIADEISNPNVTADWVVLGDPILVTTPIRR